MSKEVWLLDSGALGHWAQTAGAADMLDRFMAARGEVPPRRVVVPLDVRLRGWARGGLRLAASYAPHSAVKPLLRAAHKGLALPPNRPDLILGSSGTSAWGMRLASLQTGAPTCFVGMFEPFPAWWFNERLTPSAPAHGDIATDFLISRMTPDQARQAAASRFGETFQTQDVWALLIGGPSRSHHFDEDDWRALARSVNACARQTGVRWLIATSPRTPAQAEAILRRDINPRALKDLALWGERPDKCAAAFMGAAERVFVTRDSLTMLSEAVASGKPVVAVTPRQSECGSGDFAATLARIRDHRWAREAPRHDLCAPTDAAPATFFERLAARETRIAARIYRAMTAD